MRDAVQTPAKEFILEEKFVAKDINSSLLLLPPPSLPSTPPSSCQVFRRRITGKGRQGGEGKGGKALETILVDVIGFFFVSCIISL